MADKLPVNFAEDWGALKNDIGHIKKKVDKTCKDLDGLPCKQQDDSNPIVQIAKLKSNFGIFKWLGGFLLTGMVGFVVMISRRIFNGG